MENETDLETPKKILTRCDVPETAISVRIDPERLIALAIEKNVPVESLEKLLAMRRELKAEYARDSFFAALAQFQKECPVIEKKKKVFDKSGKLRYQYAPLDDILDQVGDILEQNGFSYMIKSRQDASSFTAICEAHHRDGHMEPTEFKVPIDESAYMNAPQKVGSARTFAMRYAFCNAFGILTGDEDNDAGSIYEKETVKPVIKTSGQKAETVIPEGSVDLYKTCITLINQRHHNIDLFSGPEKIVNKKNLDGVRDKPEALSAFHQELVKLVQKKIDEIGGNAEKGAENAD